MPYTKQYAAFKLSERKVKEWKIKRDLALANLQEAEKQLTKWNCAAELFKDYKTKYEPKIKTVQL